MHDDARYLHDFDLCHQCLEGDGRAVAELRKRCSAPAVAFLIKAGASPAEVDDLVESLWGEILMPGANGQPRIASYNGRCAFQTWFNTVALNKMITRKRKEARWRKILVPADAHPEGDRPLPPVAPTESDALDPDTPVLLQLMREALDHAFTTCDPEDFVLLQLRHCDGIMGKELAVVFGCHPSGISNRLEKAQKHISAETLWRLRQTDPWLDLRWEDFVELCRTATPASFGLD